MKILFTFLTEKKTLFWTNKKFVYLIFINKLSWYHPKITYKNILQKDMNKFIDDVGSLRIKQTICIMLLCKWIQNWTFLFKLQLEVSQILLVFRKDFDAEDANSSTFTILMCKINKIPSKQHISREYLFQEDRLSLFILGLSNSDYFMHFVLHWPSDFQQFLRLNQSYTFQLL